VAAGRLQQLGREQPLGVGDGGLARASSSGELRDERGEAAVGLAHQRTLRVVSPPRPARRGVGVRDATLELRVPLKKKKRKKRTKGEGKEVRKGK
jgi:hypothetical protein